MLEEKLIKIRISGSSFSFPLGVCPVLSGTQSYMHWEAERPSLTAQNQNCVCHPRCCIAPVEIISLIRMLTQSSQWSSRQWDFFSNHIEMITIRATHFRNSRRNCTKRLLCPWQKPQEEEWTPSKTRVTEKKH